MTSIETFTKSLEWWQMLGTITLSLLAIALGIAAVELGTALEKGTKTNIYASMAERYKMARFPNNVVIGLGIILFVCGSVLFVIFAMFSAFAVVFSLAS